MVPKTASKPGKRAPTGREMPPKLPDGPENGLKTRKTSTDRQRNASKAA